MQIPKPQKQFVDDIVVNYKAFQRSKEREKKFNEFIGIKAGKKKESNFTKKLAKKVYFRSTINDIMEQKPKE